MIRTRRATRPPIDIWPGFVDALSTLLLAVIFMLVVFVLGQFFVSQLLHQRDSAMVELRSSLAALQRQLEAEQLDNADLRQGLSQFTADLQGALTDRDRLSTELATREGTIAGLEAQLAGRDTRLATLETRLAELTEQAASAAEGRTRTLAELGAARDDAAALGAELASARERLTAERDQERDVRLAREGEIASLASQVQLLSTQLARLNAALAASEAEIATQSSTIADLGQRLNLALASQVEELGRYRSEFFGKLRQVLGDREDVRIVGDRFVFQSEVLFRSGEAELEPEGRDELTALAAAFKEIMAGLPEDLPWVLQVDGHTDRRPIATPRFPSNWQLSSARAISVAQFLINQGIPAERVAARGFAEFAPLESGDSEDAYRRNRRIELKLTTR